MHVSLHMRRGTRALFRCIVFLHSFSLDVQKHNKWVNECFCAVCGSRQSDKVEDASIHSLSALPLRYLVKKSIKRKQRREGEYCFLCHFCFAERSSGLQPHIMNRLKKCSQSQLVRSIWKRTHFPSFITDALNPCTRIWVYVRETLGCIWCLTGWNDAFM